VIPNLELFTAAKLLQLSSDNTDFKSFLKFQVTQTLTETTASLTIRKVEEEDVGNYKIKLSNNCGEASAELTLILMGMFPYFYYITHCTVLIVVIFFGIKYQCHFYAIFYELYSSHSNVNILCPNLNGTCMA
jgi:hypothetical protein